MADPYRILIQPRASEDLIAACAYIEQDSPQNAALVARQILEGVTGIRAFLHGLRPRLNHFRKRAIGLVVDDRCGGRASVVVIVRDSTISHASQSSIGSGSSPQIWVTVMKSRPLDRYHAWTPRCRTGRLRMCRTLFQ